MNPLRAFSMVATFPCVLLLAAAASAQPQSESVQQRVGELKASLARSTATLHQYQWMETTTVLIRGEQKSQTTKSCYYGAEGTLEKVPVGSPQPEEQAHGLFGRIKEHKKEEAEDFVHRAVELVKTYVPPDPSLIQSVKDRGDVSLQVVDPGRQINIVIPGYHKSGDSMTINMDIAANRLLAISVNSYLDEYVDPGSTPDEPVTMTATEGAFADGTQYTQRIELDLPSRDLQVVVENAGYVRTMPAPTPAAPTYAAPAPAPAPAPSYAAPAPAQTYAAAPTSQPSSSGGPSYTPDALDKLLAPIALYPDALILQIVQCAGSPYQVRQVNDWLRQNPTLKGSKLQDAATAQGFDASFVAIVLFPQVLQMLVDKPDWTRELGQAFTTDRSGVFDSIQRLRTQAQNIGNLKTTEQQQVKTETTSTGQQVIVIQPANPQIVYVPQYNPTVIYSQPAPATTTQSSSSDAVAAGLIGFAAGVIVGAAADNDHDHYYYSCGGWGYHGAALCNSGWNDYYDHRENMANDYYNHQDDMANQASQNQANRQQTSSQNQANRQSTSSDNQANRQSSRADAQSNASQNQSSRQSSRSETQQTASQDRSANQASRQSSAQQMQSSAQTDRSASSRGSFQNSSQSAAQRSGTSSGAFSGYQRGSSERESSSRGNSSMSRSFGGEGGGGWRSGGGGGRSGGGRRR